MLWSFVAIYFVWCTIYWICSIKNYEQAINFYYHVIVNADQASLAVVHKHNEELWSKVVMVTVNKTLMEIGQGYSETFNTDNGQDYNEQSFKCR